jgi:hypothetical protein
MEPEKPTLEYAVPPKGGRVLWEWCVRVLKSRTLRWVAVGLLSLIPMGYLSNWVSERACEAKLAGELYAQWSRRPFYTEETPYAPDTRAIFRSIGVSPLPDPPIGSQVYPRLGVFQATWAGPYQMEVKYDRVHGRGAVDGGVRRYFCFFGWVIDLGDRDRWTT